MNSRTRVKRRTILVQNSLAFCEGQCNACQLRFKCFTDNSLALIANDCPPSWGKRQLKDLLLMVDQLNEAIIVVRLR